MNIWIRKNLGSFSTIVTLVVMLIGGTIAVGMEYGEYQNVKEAAVQQKAFNDEVREKIDLIKEYQAEQRAQGARVDERTQMMYEMMKRIDGKL